MRDAADATRRAADAAITAAHVAVAMVAACRRTGVDPDAVFTSARGGRRTRMIAAAGCIARMGWPRIQTARVFQVPPVKLAPSSLCAVNVTTDDLLAVADALEARGLAGPEDGAARFRAPWTAEPEAKAQPRKVQPREAKARAARADIKIVATVETPAPTGGPGRPTPPRRIASADVAATAAPKRGRPSPVPASEAVTRLRPVSDRVVSWSRQQRDLGADMDFVAWCFDVDRAVLAEAMDPASRKVAA